MIQQSLPLAREARDAGIAQTSASNESWLERALAKLPAMKAAGHITATGEGMRVWLLTEGKLEQPKSVHAWGALVRTAMKRNLISDTGRVVQMFTEKSHARRTPLWEIK